MLRKRPDWKRPLPRPLFLPQIKTTLTTLGDVRAFLKRLPAQFRDRETWQVVARNLDSAAAGSFVGPGHFAFHSNNIALGRIRGAE